MRKLSIALLAGVALAACAEQVDIGEADPVVTAAVQPADPMASVVKVLTENGHGSGVHIGGGVILTANHIVGDHADIAVRTAGGETAKAELLWSAKDYDVAALRAPLAPGDSALGLSGFAPGTSDLDCAPLTDGDYVEARGNPGPLEFVTMRGHVAGSARTFESFKEVFVADISASQGMSGGPVTGSDGRVVGLTSALLILPTVMGDGQSVSMTLVVPSSAICMLLGREVSAAAGTVRPTGALG